MKKYIEVVEHHTEKVVRRLSVSLCTEEGANFIEDSLNDETNDNLYFVRRVKCEEELETGYLK